MVVAKRKQQVVGQRPIRKMSHATLPDEIICSSCQFRAILESATLVFDPHMSHRLMFNPSVRAPNIPIWGGAEWGGGGCHPSTHIPDDPDGLLRLSDSGFSQSPWLWRRWALRPACTLTEPHWLADYYSISRRGPNNENFFITEFAPSSRLMVIFGVSLGRNAVVFTQ